MNRVNIYYSDERLTVRSMKETDIKEIMNGFQAQGWSKPESVLEQYYQEEQNGVRLVFVAEWDGQIAGYTTLMKEAEHGPFAHNGVPYVCDFCVFKKYQRRGVGSKIMDCAEQAAFERNSRVCLGVGLHSGYGSAQRMYAKRGYIPDGSGVWYLNQCLPEYAACFNDDDLILYMEKSR